LFWLLGMGSFSLIRAFSLGYEGADLATIKTGLNVTHSRTTFASIGGQLYGCNDWNAMWVYDGIDSGVTDAGMAAAPQDWGPSPSTGSGDPTAGRHQFQYRYKNSRTGYVSDPSNIIAVTTTAGNTELTFPVAASGTGNINTSSDTKVDTIILEATLVDGGVFFTAAEGPNTASTNIVFSVSDTVLGETVLDYAVAGHTAPPYFMVVRSFKGRLWGLGRTVEETGTATGTNSSTTVSGSGTDWTNAAVGRLIHFEGDTKTYEVASVTNTTTLVITSAYTGSTHGSPVRYTIRPKNTNLLFCSDALLPESWNPLSFIAVLKAMNDTATAMISTGNALLICGSHSIEKLVFSSEPFLTVDGRPPDGQIFPVSTSRGAMNAQCLVEADGVVYGYDETGVWAWSGGQPAHLSKAVDQSLSQTYPIFGGYKGLPHLSWHPRERVIRLHTGTYSQHCTEFFEYNVDSSRWSYGTHFVPMICSAPIKASSTVIGDGVVYGDGVGYLWMADRRGFDSSLDGMVPTDPNTTGGSLVKHLVKATVKSSPSPSTTAFTINETGLDVCSTVSPSDASFVGMAGTPCYSVSLGETAPVATNTATAVTLEASALQGVGFSGAPAVGSTVYFGLIPAVLKTGWFTISEFWEKSDPRYIHLFFEPGGIDSDSQIYISLHPDPASIRGEYTTALANSSFSSAYTDWVTRSEDGISFTNGDAKIRVQMDRSGLGEGGYRKIPIGSTSWRYLQLEIGLETPPQNTWLGPIIHRIEIDGYSYESPADEV